MQEISQDQKNILGLKLSTKKQEHADLDKAIDMLVEVGTSDHMMISRLKKKKLLLKDEITKLENYLMPDIIA